MLQYVKYKRLLSIEVKIMQVQIILYLQGNNYA